MDEAESLKSAPAPIDAATADGPGRSGFVHKTVSLGSRGTGPFFIAETLQKTTYWAQAALDSPPSWP